MLGFMVCLLRGVCSCMLIEPLEGVNELQQRRDEGSQGRGVRLLR
jgi:hypothetical protein